MNVGWVRLVSPLAQSAGSRYLASAHSSKLNPLYLVHRKPFPSVSLPVEPPIRGRPDRIQMSCFHNRVHTPPYRPSSAFSFQETCQIRLPVLATHRLRCGSRWAGATRGVERPCQIWVSAGHQGTVPERDTTPLGCGQSSFLIHHTPWESQGSPPKIARPNSFPPSLRDIVGGDDTSRTHPRRPTNPRPPSETVSSLRSLFL